MKLYPGQILESEGGTRIEILETGVSTSPTIAKVKIIAAQGDYPAKWVGKVVDKFETSNIGGGCQFNPINLDLFVFEVILNETLHAYIDYYSFKDFFDEYTTNFSDFKNSISQAKDLILKCAIFATEGVIVKSIYTPIMTISLTVK